MQCNVYADFAITEGKYLITHLGVYNQVTAQFPNCSAACEFCLALVQNLVRLVSAEIQPMMQQRQLKAIAAVWFLNN